MILPCCWDFCGISEYDGTDNWGVLKLALGNPRSIKVSRASTKPSACVMELGDSSRICSQPIGGDPGGEIRNSFS